MKIGKLNQSLLVAILALVLVVSSLTAYAVVLFSFRVNGNTNGNTDTIGGSVISAEMTQTTLDFTTPGEKIDLPLTVKSTAKTNVTYNFGLSVAATDGNSVTSDELTRLFSAILVYLDGDFCGTLASLTANGEAKLGTNYLVGSGTEHTRTHTWQFELHIATEAALLGKNIDVKIATYVSSVDYTKYMFVSNADDFVKAADDINSGLVDKTQTIVLADDVTLSQAVEFANPVNIELNGNTLTLGANITLSGEGMYTLSSCVKLADSPAIGNGKIILNSKDAALDIADFTSQNGDNIGVLYSANTQVYDYSADLVGNLLRDRVSTNLANGVQSGETIGMFGALDFYANIANVTLDGDCTYNNGKITASNITATSQTSVAVAVGAYNFTCGLRVVGGDNAATLSGILADELKHIPNTIVGDAVTYDVFLPKYIEGKNVRIEWASSDPDSISADGKLADVLKENTTVTLYATIYVNDGVYATTTFTFKVTSQTRETKFKYLVAQLSPIKLTKVYKGETDAYYYLPVVDSTNANDYRTQFTMYNNDNSSVTWAAFRDIGLTNLTYTVKSGYNFITFDSTAQAVYLNSATFYTFAQMTVTGDFGDGETYTENVNVIIELGSNSELYELVFSYVEKTINDVDILQNMLDTRVKYGAKYECGDFYLPAEYQGIAITCAPATANGSGISAITKETVNGEEMWRVTVDPTKFASSESSQGIKVTVKKDGDTSDGQNRVLYVVAPAVIKPDSDGFANYSVFNSVKYQTVQKYSYTVDDKLEERLALLPDVTVSAADKELAVSKRTGFVTNSDGAVTNTTADYILAVDADNVKELKFAVGNDSGASNSHNKAYQFAQLLAWATGDVKDATLPVAVTGYSVGGTTVVTSDGKKYMTVSETAVLKDFLMKEVGFTQAEYASLWEEATTSPSGRVIDDYTEITSLAASMSLSNGMNYFKYTELLQWALNEKDFDGIAAGGNNQDSPPNLGTIGLYNVDMSGGNGTSSTTLNWSSNPSTWSYVTPSGWEEVYKRSKYYKQSTVYIEDQTEYISDAEAQCIMAFWFGVDSNANKTNAKAFATAFLNACIVPTYLHEDGAGILVNAIYDKLRENETGGFAVGITDGVPQVSILDYSVEGVNNYLGLTSFVVSGSVSSNKVVLPAFITTSSVNGCFNRVTKLDADRTETKLTKFVMKACTSGYTTLELTTLSRLTDVSHMDFSYNNGISSIGDVLNLDIKKISYLDVYGVNVSGKYLEYVLENIKVNNTSATIYYNNNTVHTAYTATTTSTSDELRFLKELTNVDSPYLLLANKVNVGNGDKTVQWYVNEGNPAYLVNDAGVDKFSEISTKEAMGRLMSNYYACAADVTVTYNGTTYDLRKNNVYQISYEVQGTSSTGSFVFTSVGTFESAVTETPDGNNIDWTGATTNTTQDYVETVSTATTPEEPYYTERYYNSDTDNNLSEIGNVSSLLTSNSGRIYFGNRAWTYVYGLYKVDKVDTLVSTYRLYPNGTRTIIKRYLKDFSVVDVEYSDGDYIEFSVTETRTYNLYFVKTDNASNVTQILKDSLPSWWGGTIDTSAYQAFTYNNTSYTYKQNSGAYYTSTFISRMGSTKSITAASTDSAYSQMVTYITGLSKTSPEYTDNVVTAVSKVENVLFTYTNPIAASSDITNAIDKATAAMDVNNRVLYKYTGATVTDNYYEKGNPVSKEYTRNQGYRLTFAASGGTLPGGYSLSEYTLQETADAVNMQAILTEANLHINDGLFGNYYGNYYCYNGTTRTIGNVTYTKGYVYRLLLKADRSGFYFEHDNLPDVKKTFTSYGTSNGLVSELVKALNKSSGCLSKGAIVYYTADNGDKDAYYAKGLYELTYNSNTNIYYFKSMGGLGNQSMDITKSGTTETAATFLLNSIVGQNLSASGISKFTNIRYIGTTSSSFYSGTGGSEQVEIVARIVDGDTVYERYFLVTVSA